MKKIFYITLLALFAFVMIACDETEYSFSIIVDNVSELRESISLDLTLVDEHGELKNSEIKASIAKENSSSTITTKVVKFDSDNKEEISFTNLDPETKYSVVIYAGYEGKKVNLVEQNYQTTNEGTETNPYKIDSYEDFSNIVKKDSDGYFKIADDVDFIDFGGKSISPLFTSTNPFLGHFDGNGKTIKNFKVADKNEDGTDKSVTSSSQYYGLFGYIGADASVSNFTLESFNINVTRSTSLSSSKASYYGLLAGYCAGTIENVTVNNSNLTIVSTSKTKEILYIGGLVGNLSEKGILSNVNVNANITVDAAYDAVVGGICGTTAKASRITKTENDAVVNVANIDKASYAGNINVNLAGTSSNAPTSIGGILGKNYSALISGCSSEGTIVLTSKFTNVGSQTLNVGGLVGWMLLDNSVLANSTSKTSFEISTYDVPKSEDDKITVNAGLLVGRNGNIVSKSTVENCEYLVDSQANTINVTGNAKVIVNNGGLIAFVTSPNNHCLLKSAVAIMVNEYKEAVEGEEAAIDNTYSINVGATE